MILNDEEKQQALESILELAGTLDIQHIGLDKPVLTRADGMGTDSHVRIITIIGVVKEDDRSYFDFEMPTRSDDADEFPFDFDDDGGGEGY